MTNVAQLKYGFEILVLASDFPGGKYSGRRDDEGRELVWSAEHVGEQDSSNLLESREAAEADLPNLASVLGCDVSELRVVEFAGITVELDTPNGPRVEYGPGDDAEAVEAALPAGYSVDFSSQITLASGRFRAPLVLETVPSSRLAYVADSDGRVVRILGDVMDGSPEEAELARSAPAGTSLVALECDATVGDRVLVDDRGVASEVVS